MEKERMEPLASGKACGKVILFGEHAVVYRRPALAVPLTQVQATSTIEPAEAGITINAPDLKQTVSLDRASPASPLAAIVRLTLAHLQLRPETLNLNLTINSTIPIASGLGSGAAVSTAIVRSLAQWANVTLDTTTVSDLVFEVEKLHHGTPSGIDNTVIAYQQSVYFVRDEPIQLFNVATPFTVIIGNTGVISSTKVAVSDVRQGWEADRAQYEAWFDQIGAIVQQARSAIETGAIDQLGPLLDQNQTLLRNIQVSGPELERLIAAAKSAGATGAKLVGGGRGGNMIALVNEHNVTAVNAALKVAGAVNTIVTEIT
jgi:mevalonate kinase